MTPHGKGKVSRTRCEDRLFGNKSLVMVRKWSQGIVLMEHNKGGKLSDICFSGICKQSVCRGT